MPSAAMRINTMFIFRLRYSSKLNDTENHPAILFISEEKVNSNISIPHKHGFANIEMFVRRISSGNEITNPSYEFYESGLTSFVIFVMKFVTSLPVLLQLEI